MVLKIAKDRLRKGLLSPKLQIIVDLSNCGLYDKDILSLVEMLHEYPHKVVTLNLSVNNIGNIGAIILSRLKNVPDIGLNYNDIGNEGAMSLVVNPCFKCIDLSSNRTINDECVSSILKTAKQHYICLANTKVSNDGKTKINSLLLENRNKASI